MASMEKMIEDYRLGLRRSGTDYHFALTRDPLDRVIRSVLKTHH